MHAKYVDIIPLSHLPHTIARPVGDVQDQQLSPGADPEVPGGLPGV